jgi:hypothetical protein
MRIWSIQKGTTPTQPDPSKVSMARSSGSREVRSVAGMGQWAKRRSFQRWVMTQGDLGMGQGRCSVVERILFFIELGQTPVR